MNRNLVYRLKQNFSNIYYAGKYINDGYIDNILNEKYTKKISKLNDINKLEKIKINEEGLKLGILKSIIMYNYLDENPTEILFSGNFNINQLNEYYEIIKFKTKFIIPSYVNLNFIFDNNTTLNIPNNTSYNIEIDNILKLSNEQIDDYNSKNVEKIQYSKYIKELTIYDNVILNQDLNFIENFNNNKSSCKCHKKNNIYMFINIFFYIIFIYLVIITVMNK